MTINGFLRMGFYNRFVLPRFIDTVCGIADTEKQRRKIVPAAEGIVVEVGIGSGLNLPIYCPTRVSKVIGVDPDGHIWKRALDRREAVPFRVDRIGVSGEEIPLDSKSADTVVVTYSLCTIPDPVKALTEMRRILKPGGRLLFAEHGESPDANVRKWQRRLDPVWKRIAGGCHAGRPILSYFDQAGWTLDRMDQGYIPGPKTLSYEYWGAAR